MGEQEAFAQTKLIKDNKLKYTYGFDGNLIPVDPINFKKIPSNIISINGHIGKLQEVKTYN